MQVVDVYLESVDTGRNRRRWYRLTAEADLFGGRVVRRWGRIGSRGRRMEQACHTYAEAVREVERVLRVRCRHGYAERPIPRNGKERS